MPHPLAQLGHPVMPRFDIAQKYGSRISPAVSPQAPERTIRRLRR